MGQEIKPFLELFVFVNGPGIDRPHGLNLRAQFRNLAFNGFRGGANVFGPLRFRLSPDGLSRQAIVARHALHDMFVLHPGFGAFHHQFVLAGALYLDIHAPFLDLFIHDLELGLLAFTFFMQGQQALSLGLESGLEVGNLLLGFPNRLFKGLDGCPVFIYPRRAFPDCCFGLRDAIAERLMLGYQVLNSLAVLGSAHIGGHYFIQHLFVIML